MQCRSLQMPEYRRSLITADRCRSPQMITTDQRRSLQITR